MSATITHAGGTITPRLVLGFEGYRTSRNILHKLLDRAAPAVTFRPAAPLSGTLELLFLTQAAARSCDSAHATGGLFTFIESEWADTEPLVYVVTDETGIRLNKDQKRWVCSIPFQAV